MPDDPQDRSGLVMPENLVWDEANLEKSLNEFFKYTIDEAEKYRKWYSDNAARNKKRARPLRRFTIILFALGGIIPVLFQILSQFGWERFLNPAWATVVIAAAGAILGLDKFFGYSRSWIRYRTTESTIIAERERLIYDWVSGRLDWEGKPPEFKHAKEMVTLLRDFSVKISNIVSEETQAWVAEFESALSRLDERMKERAEGVRLGALVVTVENGDQCDDGWTLAVEGKGERKQYGKSAAVSNIFPGTYKVIAKGDINGSPVQAELVVGISPGEITNVTITLA